MIDIGIVMGSNSDWPVMEHAARILRDFGVGLKHRWSLLTAPLICCLNMQQQRKSAGLKPLLLVPVARLTYPVC